MQQNDRIVKVMMLPVPLRYLFPLLALLGSEHVIAANVSPSMLKIERFSAERGDAQSQYFLGEHYELGDSGVEQDLAMALHWYRKAAEQEHSAAQYAIGLFYEKGHAGLSGGREAAMDWYRKAAANGSDTARTKLDEIRKAEQEAAETLRLQQQAAEREKEQQRERERARMLRASKPAMAALPIKSVQKEQKAIEYPPAQTMEKLLSANWSNSGKPAEYLPAEDMSCLKTAEDEITCFSRARKRAVKGAELSFSVKSVLSRFQRDGSFNVRYFYNVTDIDNKGNPGPAADPFGLKGVRGWQEPGLRATCSVKTWESVLCTGIGELSVSFVSN